MKIKMIIALIAIAASFASAQLYVGFSAGLGAQFYTIDSDYGSTSDVVEQSGPCMHMSFDFGFPIKADSAAMSMGIAFGGNFWMQSVEVYDTYDDTFLLMVLGPSLNIRSGRFVGGFRLGTSFVIETEDGNGGTMGFGLNSYAGLVLAYNWSLVFDAHYTTTEHNKYQDYDLSGFGVSIAYNAF